MHPPHTKRMLVLVLASGLGCGLPSVSSSCPSGSSWDGKQCVHDGEPASTQCPSGTRRGSGDACVAIAVASSVAAPVRSAQDDAQGACPPVMASIPAGSFKAKRPGGDAAFRGDPSGELFAVSAFCLDRTEVTVDAYRACVRAGTCSASGLACGRGAPFDQPGNGNHPISCVDAEQSAAFCKTQDKRLPTEVEWEWAARGGDQGRKYPWGNADAGPQLCWSGVVERSGPCAVGSFPDGNGRWGVMDLAGNVSEWTSSNYFATSLERAVRCGNWSSTNPQHAEVATRVWSDASYRDPSLGFRCAR